MSQNTQISYAIANAEANAIGSLMDGGKLRIYAGAVPAHADDPIGTAVLLAELGMGSPAFGPSANGIITANTIAPEPSAKASGSATFYRVWDSSGKNAYLQGTVGTADADMILNTTSISAGTKISIDTFTHEVVRGI